MTKTTKKTTKKKPAKPGTPVRRVRAVLDERVRSEYAEAGGGCCLPVICHDKQKLPGWYVGAMVSFDKKIGGWVLKVNGAASSPRNTHAILDSSKWTQIIQPYVIKFCPFCGRKLPAKGC